MGGVALGGRILVRMCCAMAAGQRRTGCAHPNDAEVHDAAARAAPTAARPIPQIGNGRVRTQAAGAKIAHAEEGAVRARAQHPDVMIGDLRKPRRHKARYARPGVRESTTAAANRPAPDR